MKFRKMFAASVLVVLALAITTTVWATTRKQQDRGLTASALVQTAPTFKCIDDCDDPPSNLPTGITVSIGALPANCLDSLGLNGGANRQYPLTWDSILCAWDTSFMGVDGCVYYMTATRTIGSPGSWNVSIGCLGGDGCTACSVTASVPAVFNPAQGKWVQVLDSLTGFPVTETFGGGTNCSACDTMLLTNVTPTASSVSINKAEKKALAEKIKARQFVKKPDTAEPPLANANKVN